MATITGKSAILGKLGVRNGLTPQIVGVEMTFSPSLAITTARIDRAALGIKSMREPLKKAIKEIMIPSFRMNFQKGGRPDAWEPLSESTLEVRKAFGIGSTGILVRSGTLMKVMQQQNIWKVTETTAIITDLPQRVWYGSIHQAGYEGGGMAGRIRKHGGDVGAAFQSLQDDLKYAMRTGTKVKSAGAAPIPARPFALFQDDDEDKIAELFIEWAQAKIDKVWPARRTL